jgi:hypothetical protein
MLCNASTLTVELVVLSANKLLRALGAVVALSGSAEGSSGALGAQSHARGGGAGEHALSEHVGGVVEWRFGGVVGGGGSGGFDEVRIDETELGCDGGSGHTGLADVCTVCLREGPRR